jgi:hypothetical protein
VFGIATASARQIYDVARARTATQDQITAPGGERTGHGTTRRATNDAPQRSPVSARIAPVIGFAAVAFTAAWVVHHAHS